MFSVPCLRSHVGSAEVSPHAKDVLYFGMGTRRTRYRTMMLLMWFQKTSAQKSRGIASL